MPYDLRREPWIPWRRRSGVVEWGLPSALVSRMSGGDADPVVAIAAPRPDFDGALQEFLIGLLSAALQPTDEVAWKAGWKTPPSVEEFQAALDALPDAFDLDGDGPRFFQDFTATDFAKVDSKSIDQLLIDSPGENGSKRNVDLFVKRDRYERLARATAAMALVTVQTYSPAGGAGFRTSLRGGGPLTTLIDPRQDQHGGSLAHEHPLWQKLWANVETTAQQAAGTASSRMDEPALTFPWLHVTRHSDPKKNGVATTPGNGHPLQAYFGMPRRLRLEFGDGGKCDLTGRADDRCVAGYRTVPWGIQYEGWRHPMSPYYRQSATEPWLPVHGQPSGIAWRDWLSLTLDSPDATGLRQPALAVSHFMSARAQAVGRREFRIHVFGYDVDKMKARGWIDVTVPAFATADRERRRLLHGTASHLVEATSLTASALLVAVKAALFQSPDDASGDLGQVKLELWAATEADFYGAMRVVADETLDADAASARVDDLRRAFAPILERAATDAFDRWCPGAGLDVTALRRRVAARYQLTSALRGYSRLGEDVFAALGIAPPGGGRVARAAKPRTSKERPK